MNSIESAENDFNVLSLQDGLLQNLASLGFLQMTPIQSASLPLMLQQVDVIAKAKTGSGKTAAFGLALLNNLKIDIYAMQALVLCPTRELAEQISVALRQLARLMPNVKILNLSGGMPLKPQLDSLRHGTHIVVGTPGRIQKHLSKGSLGVHKLQTVVLDEADRMLDMGFFDEIKEILISLPKKRQTLLFSATFSNDIKKLAAQFMREPKEIFIEDTHSDIVIEQHFFKTSTIEQKLTTLVALLHHFQPRSALIFCNTKNQTVDVTSRLIQAGFSATALNGDLEQVDRDLAIIRFVNFSCPILVATDVAARGLDIKELPLVINFDLAFEKDVHTHRIGRTGRAGHKGLALSLTTNGDAERIRLIEENLGHPITWGSLEKYKKSNNKINLPEMITLRIMAGRKDKIRPGDILGALTKDAGMLAAEIGKIDITPNYSYVAIAREQAKKACQYFQTGRLKGRKVIVKI